MMAIVTTSAAFLLTLGVIAVLVLLRWLG